LIRTGPANPFWPAGYNLKAIYEDISLSASFQRDVKGDRKFKNISAADYVQFKQSNQNLVPYNVLVKNKFNTSKTITSVPLLLYLPAWPPGPPVFWKPHILPPGMLL